MFRCLSQPSTSFSTFASLSIQKLPSNHLFLVEHISNYCTVRDSFQPSNRVYFFHIEERLRTERRTMPMAAFTMKRSLHRIGMRSCVPRSQGVVLMKLSHLEKKSEWNSPWEIHWMNVLMATSFHFVTPLYFLASTIALSKSMVVASVFCDAGSFEAFMRMDFTIDSRQFHFQYQTMGFSRKWSPSISPKLPVFVFRSLKSKCVENSSWNIEEHRRKVFKHHICMLHLSSKGNPKH